MRKKKPADVAKSMERWTTRMKLMVSNAEDLWAEISHTRHRNGQVDMVGRITDANGNWLEEYRAMQKRGSKSDAEVAADERTLVARLETEWRNAHTQDVSKLEGENIYTNAFDALSPEELRALCPPSWHAKNSIRQGLSGVRRVLEHLDPLGDTVDEGDWIELEQKLAAEAAKHGNAFGDPEYSKAGNVRRSLANFTKIYPLLRVQYPGLPDIPMPTVQGAQKAVGIERCKALPMETLVRLYQRLLEASATNPQALAIGLMLLSGCRTGEACAIQIESIEFRTVGRLTYAVCAILYTANGDVRSVTKTAESNRIIIMPLEMVVLIRQRIQELESQGFTWEEIRKMYLVSKAEDPYAMEDVTKVSTYGRKVLQEVGVTSDYWDAVRAAMWLEHDLDAFQRPEKDPTAYALRRAAISIWCNICGMDPNLVDALVGHVVKDNFGKQKWRKYTSRPDSWPVIAEQMSRMVYNPIHTANPAFSPVTLGQDKMYLAKMPHGGFLLKAEEDGEYEIRVDLEEVLDDLIIKGPEKRKTKIEVDYQLTGSSRQGGVIGKTCSEEWYKTVLDNATAKEGENDHEE